MEPWMVIVLLGVVVFLYAFLLPKTAPRKVVDEEVLDSVEGTLQQFVEDMEQENREFARMVGEMKREHERKATTLEDRIEYLEGKINMMTEQLTARTFSTPMQPKAEDTVQASARAPEQQKPVTKAPNSFKDRYKEVFELHNKGKSIEYIAKKLGTNKGEILLIMQLAKQEEQTDAAQ